MAQRITTKRRDAKNRKQTKQQGMNIPAYGGSFALHVVPNIKKSWPSVIKAGAGFLLCPLQSNKSLQELD